MRVKLVQGDRKPYTLIFYHNDGTLKDLTGLIVRLDYSIEGVYIGTIEGVLLDQVVYTGQATIEFLSNSLSALSHDIGMLKGEPYLVDGQGNTNRNFNFVWIEIRKPLNAI